MISADPKYIGILGSKLALRMSLKLLYIYLDLTKFESLSARVHNIIHSCFGDGTEHYHNIIMQYYHTYVLYTQEIVCLKLYRTTKINNFSGTEYIYFLFCLHMHVQGMLIPDKYLCHSPLMIACEEDKKNIVELLLNNGASVALKNKVGITEYASQLLYFIEP